MNITKRITKFLLIAALAIPAWNAASAQKPTAPPEKVATEVDAEKAMIAPVKIVSNVSADEWAAMSVEQRKDAAKPFKSAKLQNGAQPKILKVTKVTKTRADVPAGYSLITLNVAENPWTDGSGYQMLLDADHSTYGSTISTSGALTSSGNASAATYAEFEYKIPENADGSLTTTNMIASGSQSITIPAGTYDWCITNPSPGDRVWIASTYGEIQGRYDDYVFESGFAYVFTISSIVDSGSTHDQVSIGITSNFENPTDLAVSNIYKDRAKLTWTPGGNETSWNVQYKNKGDYAWISAGTTSSTNYNLEGLSASTDYQARVQGIYAGGLSGWEMVTFKTTNDEAPLCDPEDMGEISYTLTDSYGDGWNSASIQIKDDETGNVIQTLTISSGSSASGTVSLCYGRTVNFVWTSGSYDYECSFTITDPDGDEIYSATSGSSLTNGGTFATYTMNMPVKPTNLAVSGVSYNRAIATWNGVTETYNLRYRPNGETNWVVVENVTSPYTMTGLAPLTQYEVQVQGVLDGGVSNWTNSVLFTTLEGPTQSLDFGSVNVNSNKTLNAKLMNESGSDVQATITVNPNPPFSVASTTVTLAAGTLTSIPVTFTPGAAIGYTGTLTVTVNGENTVITLRGAGHADGPGAIRDEAFFEGITYTWTNDEGTHTSNLSEIATDPDQIIAMLKEVYVNRNIPGNYKRGYTTSGTSDHDDNVMYTGVGRINSSGQYENTYGWNIPGTVLSSTGSTSYKYMQEDQYKPYDEGVTLLLLEIVDDFDVTTVATNGDPTHDYAGLKAYFKKAIKSARVVTKATRVGKNSDFSSGTLFKIDCNKMNKFYLIAKGQLSWLQQRYNNIKQSEASSSDYYSFYGYPCYYSSGGGYLDYGLYGNYLDKEPAFLCHMFEQLSPAEGSATSAPLSDGYQMFVTEMKSFGIEHDCPNVPFVYGTGHHFMMYGADSPSDDCQDIRDMMLLVPDYRMMNWQYRGSKSSTSTSTDGRRQDYFNYNTSHQPKIGVFVIHQNPITGDQIENQETYKLHLTWKSNLLDFLPEKAGQYDLYRVITNADGTKTYQKVGEFDPNTFEYYDNVPMQKTGQQVTYVVQGQDIDGFLSLQMSNEESFIIPGYDHAEQLRIDLNSDYYFSRYDAAEQKNYYSNSLIANNTVGTNVRPEYIENGSQFKFWRATLKTVDGEAVVDTEHAVNFVTAEVGNYTQTGGGKLTYGSWVDQTPFGNKPYGHGYHANPTTSDITIVNGEVKFAGLKLYDNFCVDVSENAHPSQYVYYVTLETAVPFGLDQDLPSCAVWQDGKTYAYFEAQYSDWKNVRAWVWNDSENFSEGSFPGTYMTKVGTSGNKTIWRWSIDRVVEPTKIIFWLQDNYNNEYEIAQVDFVNGGYYNSQLVNDNGNYYILSSLVATVSEDNNSNQARSNTVAVPVYKTEMEMKPITAAQVEADIDHKAPAATKFELDARYSSKTEILGYYIYRWADKAGASARTIYESNGDDSSPQGQAGNQGEYYTVAMNTDYTAETEHFASDYADVTATFLDNFMNNEAEDADTYTYAPVVELFAPAQAVIISTGNDNGEDRDDYNTYGGPQQMTAGGTIKITPGDIVATSDEFTAEVYGATTAPTCKYYYIPLTINVDVPNGYSIYKVRAWRLIDKQWLGEMQAQSTRVSDDYLYDTLNGAAEEVDVFVGVDSEDGNTHHHKGLFGAKSLSNTESFDATFIVRVYFTKPSKDGEVKYYIAEKQETVNVNNQNIITGVVNVKSNKQVVGVKYYNMAGIESDQPFDGVNIVVTRYTDGSTSTSKVIK